MCKRPDSSRMWRYRIRSIPALPGHIAAQMTGDISVTKSYQNDIEIVDKHVPLAVAKRDIPIGNPDGTQLSVNEINNAPEGEGGLVGYATTRIRLSYCNLDCEFCDTEFNYAIRMTIDQILEKVKRYSSIWISITGGEPLIRNIVPLCRALKAEGYKLHIETNGTVAPGSELLELIDYWTVSPKTKRVVSELQRIDELKYVVNKQFFEEDVEEDRADHIYLQPQDNDPVYIWQALDVLRRHPTWRLSIQVHKLINLP